MLDDAEMIELCQDITFLLKALDGGLKGSNALKIMRFLQSLSFLEADR